jgi:hypothetical protein
MASAFSITTTTNAITLGDDRSALVAFTVSNQLGRAVRVRTSVSPEPPTPAEWFAIEGETERMFPSGGAEAYNVRITVPLGAPEGPNAFRLDAVAADRPDDEWAHGPLVGFDVPPTIIERPKEVAPGYVETLLGALAGAVVAFLALTISNIIVLLLIGANFSSMGPSFRILLFGETFALAAAGGVGAVAGLLVRSIPDPAPWRTGAAFAALATLILTILHAILITAIPLFPDGLGVIVTVIGSLVVVALVALIARAIGRFLGFGKL